MKIQIHLQQNNSVTVLRFIGWTFPPMNLRSPVSKCRQLPLAAEAHSGGVSHSAVHHLCLPVALLLLPTPPLSPTSPPCLAGIQREPSCDWCSCAWQGDLCQVASNPIVLDSQLTWLGLGLPVRLQRAQPSRIPKAEASHIQAHGFKYDRILNAQ